MLTAQDVLKIRDLKFLSGKTYEDIHDLLGFSSKTIAKALLRPEDILEGYKRSRPHPLPVLGPWEEKIAQLLQGPQWARELEGGRRVRRTARWVFGRISKEGFQGSESSVRRYIREHFKQSRPFCPIEHPPGEEAQFDFGESVVRVGGQVTPVHVAGSVFCYSTRRLLYPYPAERQECLFDAMEETYRFAGGVSRKATLDNTGLAVKKVLEGRNRLETTEYLRFRTMLGVEARFTTPAAGWEKGHVEGTVGWAKRGVLCDLEVEDWDELKRVLLEACEKDAQTRRHGPEGKLVAELFEEERRFLRPIPYEGRRSYRTVRAKVSPSGQIRVDGSRYSVPIGLRDRTCRVRLFADELVVYFGETEVARYERDWSGRGQHYRMEHYIPLLERAPALLDHGKPFFQMPEWVRRTRQALRDDQALVTLLLGVERGKYTLGELERAATEVLATGSVTRARIEERALGLRAFCGRTSEESREADWASLTARVGSEVEPEIYDEILLGRAKP